MTLVAQKAFEVNGTVVRVVNPKPYVTEVFDPQLNKLKKIRVDGFLVRFLAPDDPVIQKCTGSRFVELVEDRLVAIAVPDGVLDESL